MGNFTHSSKLFDALGSASGKSKGTGEGLHEEQSTLQRCQSLQNVAEFQSSWWRSEELALLLLAVASFCYSLSWVNVRQTES